MIYTMTTSSWVSSYLKLAPRGWAELYCKTISQHRDAQYVLRSRGIGLRLNTRIRGRASSSSCEMITRPPVAWFSWSCIHFSSAVRERLDLTSAVRHRVSTHCSNQDLTKARATYFPFWSLFGAMRPSVMVHVWRNNPDWCRMHGSRRHTAPYERRNDRTEVLRDYTLESSLVSIGCQNITSALRLLIRK